MMLMLMMLLMMMMMMILMSVRLLVRFRHGDGCNTHAGSSDDQLGFCRGRRQFCYHALEMLLPLF